MTTPFNLFPPQVCLREEFEHQIPTNDSKQNLGCSLNGSTVSTGETNEPPINSYIMFKNNYFDNPDISCLNSPLQWTIFDKDLTESNLYGKPSFSSIMEETNQVNFNNNHTLDFQNNNDNLNENSPNLKKNEKDLQELFDQKYVQPFLRSYQDSNRSLISDEKPTQCDNSFQKNNKKMTEEDKNIKLIEQSLSDENRPRIEPPSKNNNRVSKYNNIYKGIYNYIKELLREWLELSSEDLDKLKSEQLWNRKRGKIQELF